MPLRDLEKKNEKLKSSGHISSHEDKEFKKLGLVYKDEKTKLGEIENGTILWGCPHCASILREEKENTAIIEHVKKAMEGIGPATLSPEERDALEDFLIEDYSAKLAGVTFSISSKNPNAIFPNAENAKKIAEALVRKGVKNFKHLIAKIKVQAPTQGFTKKSLLAAIERYQPVSRLGF